MKAMILAAGRGSRMGNLTENTPKPLTKIGNATLIEHNIKRLKSSGIIDICINVSYLGYKIKNHLKNGSHLGVNIKYFDESKKMLGTGGGILNALSFLGKNPFWLVNADLFSDFIIPSQKKLKNNVKGHLILVKNPDHNPGGDFDLIDDKVSFYEGDKPLTYSGMSLLSPKLFSSINKKIFPLEPILEKNAFNGSLSGEYFTGNWCDVGTKERLDSIQELIKYK